MLTIYRASAGAGKTHKLTGEYLLLLFSQPNAYRRILAVTFTNKATDEMKGRIIEELYRLASGQPSDYVNLLAGAYPLDEGQIRTQARKTLIAILHDYSAFNISTIDRFFQQTMRAFTREIGLQGGYGIEMDQDMVLGEAVDRMLASLDRPGNKTLLGWLLRFGEDKIERGETWDLRGDILTLGGEVFKESFKAFSDELLKDIEDKKALENYQGTLYRILNGVEKEVRDIGSRALRVLKEYGLETTDFKGGRNSALNHFKRWKAGEMKEPTDSFLALEGNVAGCFTKSTPPEKQEAIRQAFEGGLGDCISLAIARFSQLTDYYTAKEIARYYYTLGILTDISRHIAEYREEKNIMLLADTTELLNKVIAGSDAPFIYEKTGTHVDHYMIDEFQDTSGMQWSNFRPLIEESLAHDRENLLVGDVKQSIYRFRNSDWKLLDEQVARDFAAGQVREATLKENWRSCRHIVEFNNALFTAAPYLLQVLYNSNIDNSSLDEKERDLFRTRLMSAYKKTFQQVPPPFQQKDGHVKIEFIAQDDDETDWRTEALNRLPAILEQLQANGYALKDIAILVRTNREGAAVAEALLDYKKTHAESAFRYDIISDDALFVGSSAVVRFFLHILRYLKNPESATARKMALFAYRLLAGDWSLENFTPEEDEELRRLGCLPLYEMAEGIYRLFNRYILAENEQVFIQAFLDMVAEFAQKESTDLSRFLRWWDDTGYRKTISTPEGQNAIRILTVHKSKGLGFRTVIIPFADWEIDHKPTKPVILWCHPQSEPFNRLHLVPVRYSQVLGKTIFAQDYFKEKLHAYIDNLNTLYVAFTRSKEELIVLAPRPKNLNENFNSVSTLLWNCLKTYIPETAEKEPLIDLTASFDEQEGSFELGNWWHPAPQATDETTIEIPIRPLCSVSPDDRLHLRLHGKDFFFDNKQRKYGTLMHEVLSGIRTKEDIIPTVENYHTSGIIDKDEARRLVQRLTTLIGKPDVAPWYNGKARILNEVEILFDRGNTRRPDRVMLYPDRVVIVDYKFGERMEKRHLSQVRTYLRLVRDMGYPQVEGYLWYVELDQIIPVKTNDNAS